MATLVAGLHARVQAALAASHGGAPPLPLWIHLHLAAVARVGEVGDWGMTRWGIGELRGRVSMETRSI